MRYEGYQWIITFEPLAQTLAQTWIYQLVAYIVSIRARAGLDYWLGSS